MTLRTRKFQKLALEKNVSSLASPYLYAILLCSCFIFQASASLERGDVNNKEKSNLIGCLFADDLCNPEEICFDDLAFGKCISSVEPDDNEFYRYDTFSEEASDFLELELDQLKNNGYTWSDDYSQCIVQVALNAIRFDGEFDSALCKEFMVESIVEDPSNTVEPRLEKKEDDSDNEQPPVHKSLKVWTDDPDDPHALAYKASEVSDSIPGFYGVNEQDGSILIEPQESGVEILSENKAESENSYNIPADLEDNFQSQLDLENNLENNLESQLDLENSLQEEILDPADFLMNYEVPNEDDIIFPRESLADIEDEELPVETRALETPIHLQGIDDNDVLYRHKFGYEKRSRSTSEGDLSDNDENRKFDVIESSGQEIGNPEFYFIPSEGSNSEDLIFNRNERFDVKKPGPFFPNSANNFFLNKIIGEEEGANNKQDGIDRQDPFGPRDNQNSEQKGQIEFEQPMLAPVKDKRLLPVFDNVINENEDGKNFVHIILKKRLQTWMQGSNMIRHLAKELGIPEEALTDRRIEDQHVQFRVEPNPQNINAETMANVLGEDHDIQKRVEDKLGIDIHKVIAGQQNEYQSAMFTGSVDPNMLLGLTVAVATTCVLVVSIFALILIKRRRKQLRLKQNQLEQEEEDSRLRDQYSQLCRDWSNTSKPTSGGDNSANDNSAAKSIDGAKETCSSQVTPVSSKKISSRDSSKDIEGSNRSSTSSGPDEPTASNMDISTGHMVLAYMEDHLKNKQRLEQEWVALCGYEAEPCATTVAFKAENKKKNRYPDKLPYDHNRVILNAVLNKNNSDYINASTVTDHDPRNPPYIVTQGPLSQTVADFWQMVWEQGCVVIVMLSRLQDNGYHLCHRYWPEEGSEKYHIFEVHLVSEHVWCDDYLVRSVYLKNTRTGETRTVTQFHFRSWPAHGVPTSTKALLEFRRKVNKSYRGRSCPIIVHCSDGVGRSGTYILIDMVLNRMAKGCKEIDIAATLEHIRDQRGGMVQTRQQFEFCLMAVAEEVHAILKALPQ